MNKITAIIPVRAGSRRLKNKNILPFNGTNLLINKIRRLKQVEQIDKIIVSSDSDEYLKMAKNENVDIHKREERFSDEVTEPFGKVVENICSNVIGDDIIWSPCVSPLLESSTISKAIETYQNMSKSEFDSLVGVEILKYYLWNDDGPINYEFGINHVKSQDLPNIYHPTNAIFIAPREKMIEWKYFHGKNPYKFILSKKESVDIDDELDYECAKAFLQCK